MRSFSKTGYFVRYMDDIPILVVTRWKLRRMVNRLSESCVAA
jgi:hypothetical protein